MIDSRQRPANALLKTYHQWASKGDLYQEVAAAWSMDQAIIGFVVDNLVGSPERGLGIAYELGYWRGAARSLEQAP